MALRRELTDVADGIARQFIRKLWRSPKTSPIAALGLGHKNGLGLSYTFDLVTGAATPASLELSSLARDLSTDLDHHLQERRIDHDEVATATMTVTFGETLNARRPLGPYRCLVAITDDLGHNYSAVQTSEMAQFRDLTISGIFCGVFDFLFHAR